MTDPKELLRVRPFQVREIKWETPAVYTLVLEPAAEEAMVPFLAGQWLYLHLMKEDGTSAGRAVFSIASAPSESALSLDLGLKVAGGFTQAASKLMPGDSVGLQGPFGIFTLKDDEEEPLIFFAGGIGITPFRSMVRELWRRGSRRSVVLFYSNREVEEVAYWEEFERMAKEMASFKPVFILTTDDVPPVWAGETRRLDAAMVKAHVPDLSRGSFLMCGPQGYMEAVKSILEGEGVDTKARLRKELFG